MLSAKLRKQLLLAFIGLCSFNMALAANNMSTQPVQAPSSGDTTNAIAFAIQAGQIAGTAQACGINIAVFTTRVNEAINKLALNPTDGTAAINSFQQALQRSQTLQANSHSFACSQVTQDFNSLPLLRPDYEQTVIAQLNPGMTNNNAPANATPATNAAPATSNNLPSNNPAMGNNPTAPNQQQNLMNQPMQNTAPSNNLNNNAMSGQNNTNNPANKNAYGNTANNPAYPQQNYGPMKSLSTNFPGAVKSYGQANTAEQNSNYNNSNYANAPSYNNNPPPPSFSNPNNVPTANNNAPNP